MPRLKIAYSEGDGSADRESPTRSVPYLIHDVDSLDQALTYFFAAVPATFSTDATGLLYLQSARVAEKRATRVFLGTAQYGPRKPAEVGESELRFTIGGKTEKVQCALEQVRYPKADIPAAGDEPLIKAAPDHFGLILADPKEQRVEGTDVPVRCMDWEETHYFPINQLTHTYLDTLEAMAGCWNSRTFRNRERGSVRFKGATGSAKGRSKVAPITFSFEHSRNRKNFRVGRIPVALKRGWDHLEIHTSTEVDPVSKQLRLRPIAVYVNKVTDDADFAKLGIGN